MKDFLFESYSNEQLFDVLNSLAKQVVQSLKQRGQTVAFAESCTGGLLAKTITDVSGASNVFECGVTAYSERIKQQVLGVQAETLQTYSVVSPETAAEMAEGVRRLSGADFGIGVTGVAGPGPDGNHPEGEIYIDLAAETGHTPYAMNRRSEHERTRNRLLAACYALALLADAIDGENYA